jgi:putative ABC transport system permease protein
MNFLTQLAAVTLMGMRAIPRRLGASTVIVIGMASVVAVTISILSLSIGFMRAVTSTARDDQAIVLSQGSLVEAESAIQRDRVLTIIDAPGVKRDVDGQPIASPEFLINVPVPKKRDGLEVYIGLRGIGPKFFKLHPDIKLVSGRLFVPGHRELIVGKAAEEQFAGLEVGNHIALPAGDWTVTGIYDSHGDMFDSELLGDAETVIPALRYNVFSAVWVLLARPDAFAQFKHALTTNPTLGVDVMTGPEYWQSVSKDLTPILTMVAYVVGGIMGLGAIFAALNTMYTVVSTRSVEIATLRAIGFDGRVVITSVLIESLSLAVVGALIGAGIAWFAFNDAPHVTGQIVISLTVTPALIGQGIIFACTLGFIGGLLPAIRAATVPVVSGLRAT